MLSNFGRKFATRSMVLIVTLSVSFLLFQLSKCCFDLLLENKLERRNRISQNVHDYPGKNSFENTRRLPQGIRQDRVEEETVQVHVSRPWRRRQENGKREKRTEKTSMRSYIQALERKDAENRKEIERLLIEIRSLKEQLAICNLSLPPPPPASFSSFSLRDFGADAVNRCAVHVQRMLDSAEIGNGVRLNNEHEVIPFNYFTLDRMHPADLNSGKRVVEKLVGHKRRDLTEAVQKALETLNSGIGTASPPPPLAKWRGTKSNGTKAAAYVFDDLLSKKFR